MAERHNASLEFDERVSSDEEKVEQDHNWDNDVICVVDGNPYWLVEEIRDVRVDNKGKLLYLVKWVDYPESVNSWEPEENCSLARRLIHEFHQRMSEARKHQLGQQMLMKSKPVATAKPTIGKGIKRIASAKNQAKRPSPTTSVAP